MKIPCKFLGARTLKDGSKTGMLVFPEGSDKHALVDLEGDVFLTNERGTPAKEAILSDIRAQLERLNDFIEKEKKEEGANENDTNTGTIQKID